MTRKRAITLSLVLPFLLLVRSAIGEPANTPEELIHDLDASVKAKDADRFLSQLTTESHKKVNDWLASQADLQRAQDDFRKALDEKFPESRTNETPAPRDLKQVLGDITSLEFVSKKEGPDARGRRLFLVGLGMEQLRQPNPLLRRECRRRVVGRVKR